jgi:hypothetical protein
MDDTMDTSSGHSRCDEPPYSDQKSTGNEMVNIGLDILLRRRRSCEQEAHFFVKLIALDMKYAIKTVMPTSTFLVISEEGKVNSDAAHYIERGLIKRQDTILDSYAIRCEGWDGLLSSSATCFGLPEDTDSSEVNADANNTNDQLKYLFIKKKQ